MPTKKSRITRTARKVYADGLDKALLQAPWYVKQRLGQPSKLEKSLRAVGQYGWSGFKFCASGQAIKPRKMTSANRDRHQESLATIKAIAKRYRHLWGHRTAAGTIARLEGLSADTVRRYKRLLPFIE